MTRPLCDILPGPHGMPDQRKRPPSQRQEWKKASWRGCGPLKWLLGGPVTHACQERLDGRSFRSIASDHHQPSTQRASSFCLQSEKRRTRLWTLGRGDATFQDGQPLIVIIDRTRRVKKSRPGDTWRLSSFGRGHQHGHLSARQAGLRWR